MIVSRSRRITITCVQPAIKISFLAGMLLLFTSSIVVRPSNATIVWTSPTYLADPEYEGTAGTYVGFDASGKCLDSQGLSLSYTVQDCPFGLTPYFTFNGTKMVLAQTFSVTTLSGWIPDCAIICSNSNGSSSTAYVTINIYSGNNHAPYFSNSFPRYEYVTNGSTGANILTAYAYDNDTDWTTNSNLTWYVASFDSYSQYFGFYNTTSPILRVNKTIDWTAGTERVIVLGVHDNPNVGSQLSATVSVTLCWGCPVYTGSSTTSSTTIPTSTSITQSVAFLVPVIVGSILVGAALLAGGIVCCLYYCKRDSAPSWSEPYWAPNNRVIPKFANDDW